MAHHNLPSNMGVCQVHSEMHPLQPCNQLEFPMGESKQTVVKLAGWAGLKLQASAGLPAACELVVQHIAERQGASKLNVRQARF